MMQLIFLALQLACLYSLAHGHGYLFQPTSRTSLILDPNFRDQVVEAEYNYMGLNCGGQSHQWTVNKGKCGVCGEAYDEANKLYEFGGKRYQGLKTGSYRAGATIDVKVVITSFHRGYFQFRIANSHCHREVTQDELKSHLLQVVYPDGTKRDRYELPLGGTNKEYAIKVELPAGFTCCRCVFQWWWRCGNSWGCEGTQRKRECGLGKGEQENFVNCADVSIYDGEKCEKCIGTEGGTGGNGGGKTGGNGGGETGGNGGGETGGNGGGETGGNGGGETGGNGGGETGGNGGGETGGNGGGETGGNGGGQTGGNVGGGTDVKVGGQTGGNENKKKMACNSAGVFKSAANDAWCNYHCNFTVPRFCPPVFCSCKEEQNEAPRK